MAYPLVNNGIDAFEKILLHIENEFFIGYAVFCVYGGKKVFKHIVVHIVCFKNAGVVGVNLKKPFVFLNIFQVRQQVFGRDKVQIAFIELPYIRCIGDIFKSTFGQEVADQALMCIPKALKLIIANLKKGCQEAPHKTAIAVDEISAQTKANIARAQAGVYKTTAAYGTHPHGIKVVDASDYSAEELTRSFNEFLKEKGLDREYAVEVTDEE